MRFGTLLLGLMMVVVGLPAIAEPPARTVAEGTNIDWSYVNGPTPARFRIGDVTLIFEGAPDPEIPDLILPTLAVQIGNRPPVRLEGESTPGSFDHRATVGRWDSNRPYVLFQSFSGGAHCCTHYQLVYPEGGRLQVVDLGEWDSGYWDRLPTDRNGDGRIDFEFVDNAFLYAFASYAESWAPPLIMNVVGGRAVDVSTDPGFRPLYEAEMAREREACLRPEDGAYPNGACAAYVASAARLGRFDRAWAEMLRAYDRTSGWTLPPGCRTALVDSQCPAGQEIEYSNYPDALRAFLVQQNYLER